MIHPHPSNRPGATLRLRDRSEPLPDDERGFQDALLHAAGRTRHVDGSYEVAVSVHHYPIADIHDLLLTGAIHDALWATYRRAFPDAPPVPPPDVAAFFCGAAEELQFLPLSTGVHAKAASLLAHVLNDVVLANERWREYKDHLPASAACFDLRADGSDPTWFTVALAVLAYHSAALCDTGLAVADSNPDHAQPSRSGFVLHRRHRFDPTRESLGAWGRRLGLSTHQVEWGHHSLRLTRAFSYPRLGERLAEQFRHLLPDDCASVLIGGLPTICDPMRSRQRRTLFWCVARIEIWRNYRRLKATIERDDGQAALMKAEELRLMNPLKERYI
jgi:hypothetical protein